MATIFFVLVIAAFAGLLFYALNNQDSTTIEQVMTAEAECDRAIAEAERLVGAKCPNNQEAQAAINEARRWKAMNKHSTGAIVTNGTIVRWRKQGTAAAQRAISIANSTA